MRNTRRAARLNVKALAILTVITGLIGVGAVGGHYIRKRVVAKSAYKEGMAFLADKQWEPACKKLKRYLLQYPDDQDILEQYAYANLRIEPLEPKHLSRAEGAFRRLLRHRPGDDEICDELAKLYLQAGNADEAIYISRKRLEQDPKDTSAMLYLSRGLLNMQETEEAESVLTALLESNPGELQAYALIVDLLLERGGDANQEQARQWTDLCIEKNPDAPMAWVRRARFARRIEKDAVSARSDVEKADAFPSVDPVVRCMIAEEWIFLGDYDRAETALATIKNISDETLAEKDIPAGTFRYDWHTLAGNLAKRRGDKEAMGRQADESLATLTNSFRTFYLPTAIDLYLVSGRIDDARKRQVEYEAFVVDRFSENAPGRRNSKILAARIALAENRPYDAINALRIMVTKNSNLINCWRLLADGYRSTGQYRLAADSLNQVLKRRPSDAKIRKQLVRTLMRLGRWSDAVTHARYLETENPNDVEVRLLRLESAMHEATTDGVDTEALSGLRVELQQLQSKHPQISEIGVLFAQIMEAEGRTDDAIDLLRAIHDSGNGATAATIRLGRLLSARGDHEEALTVYTEGANRHPERAASWINLAEAYASLDQDEQSQNALLDGLKQVEDAKEHLDVWLTLARWHLDRDDRETGLTTLKEIAKANPLDLLSRTTMLELREVLEDRDTAQTLVENLAKIEGETGLQWRLHKARLWLNGENWKDHEEQIVQYLEYCVNADPAWSRPASLLGNLYELSGQDDLAEAVYRRALHANPQAIKIVDQLLKLLERENRFADAREVLAGASENHGLLTSHRVGLALDSGAYEDAILALRASVKARPDDVGSRALLARLIYQHEQNAAEAIQLLEEAEAISPQSPTVASTWAFVLLAENRGDEAVAILYEMVESRKDATAYALRAELHATRGALKLAEQDLLAITQLEGSVEQGYEQLGQFYIRQNRREDAMSAWEAGLAISPNNMGLRRRLATALLVDDDAAKRSRGQDMLESLLQETPEDTELLATKAAHLLMLRDENSVNEARQIFERVVEKDERAISAYIALIQVAVTRNDLQEATRIVTRALGANPGNYDLLMAGAEVERLKGNFDESRNFASWGHDQNPRTIIPLVFLSDLAIRENNLADALMYIDSAILLADSDRTLQLKRAAILDAQGKLGQAIEDLARFANTDAGKKSLEISLALADSSCRNGDSAGFERYMNQAREIDAENPVIVQAEMRCWSVGGAFDSVVAKLSERLETHPQDTRTILLGAGLLASTREARWMGLADGFYARVIEADPDQIEALLSRGQLAYLRKDFQRMKECYRSVLKRFPDHHKALNDLAWILAELGEDLEEARRLADHAVEIAGDDPHVLDTRGVVLTKSGLLNDARKDLERAVVLSSLLPRTQANAMTHLADVFKAMDRPAKAREQLRKAMLLDSEHSLWNEERRSEVQRTLDDLRGI